MIKALLKSYGLKATLPRINVLEIFHQAKQKHLSAENIAVLMENTQKPMSLATIYRILTQFEQAGLLVRHNFSNHDNTMLFELASREHHDHLICTQCGKIEEFLDGMIEQRQANIVKQYGFTMLSHALHIYGICHHCHKSV